jgi:hypothetical protein
LLWRNQPTLPPGHPFHHTLWMAERATAAATCVGHVMAAVVVGSWGQRAALSKGKLAGAGGHAQDLFLLLAQVVHVQRAMRVEPVLVPFNRECPDQAQAALRVRQDPGAPLDLFAHALQQVLVVLARHRIGGARLLDGVLDPAAELGLGEPGTEVATGLGQVTRSYSQRSVQVVHVILDNYATHKHPKLMRAEPTSATSTRSG